MPHEAWMWLLRSAVIAVPGWFVLDATLGRLVRWVHRHDA